MPSNGQGRIPKFRIDIYDFLIIFRGSDQKEMIYFWKQLCSIVKLLFEVKWMRKGSGRYSQKSFAVGFGGYSNVLQYQMLWMS